MHPHLMTAYILGQRAGGEEFIKDAALSPAEAAAVREELPSAIARIQAAIQHGLLGTPLGQMTMGAGTGAMAGHLIPPGQDRPGQSSLGSGALGGMAGGTAGALLGLPLAQALKKNPKLALLAMLGLPLAGAVGGGYLGGQSAKTEHPIQERLGIE
jgi:hypothetical protein